MSISLHQALQSAQQALEQPDMQSLPQQARACMTGQLQDMAVLVTQLIARIG